MHPEPKIFIINDNLAVQQTGYKADASAPGDLIIIDEVNLLSNVKENLVDVAKEICKFCFLIVPFVCFVNQVIAPCFFGFPQIKMP